MLVVLAPAACGGADVERLEADARRKVEEAQGRADAFRADARAVRDRLRQRVRETLDKLERAIPEAGPTTQPPRRGDAGLEAFLTETLTSVDAYWTETLRASGFPEPRVSYNWIPPGGRVRTGCGQAADGNAALYCPVDDTIYVAQEFAAGVLQGIRDDFPGQAAGEGQAIGDFGVAFIVAHEYAHNVQQELGLFEASRSVSVKPFELQADCMAGAWGNSVYQEGKLEPGDVEEALSTAKAVGDFEYLSTRHHGTPDERRAAWLRGYSSGDPSECAAFAPRT